MADHPQAARLHDRLEQGPEDAAGKPHADPPIDDLEALLVAPRRARRWRLLK
jgi:hypothetical protein